MALRSRTTDGFSPRGSLRNDISREGAPTVNPVTTPGLEIDGHSTVGIAYGWLACTKFTKILADFPRGIELAHARSS